MRELVNAWAHRKTLSNPLLDAGEKAQIASAAVELGDVAPEPVVVRRKTFSDELREILSHQPPDLESIGFVGEVSRAYAEEILANYEQGNFLTRWSKQSFVLSYIERKKRLRGRGFVHVGQIRPDPETGMLSLITDRQTCAQYPSLAAYVQRMQRLGHVTQPIAVTVDAAN